MARNRGRTKGRGGVKSFGGLPKAVWLHPDYSTLKSGNAVRLLMDFACQYNGRNNGDLTAAYSVLRGRGWRSQDTINNAVEQLIDAGLVVRSREGRFCNPGGRCHHYALTWLSVDECLGKDLDLAPTTTTIGKFSLEANANPSPGTGDVSHQKPAPERPRDSRGRYSSHQKPPPLVVVTDTRNW